ncbi:hypothetical protein BGZ72_002377 [Mortierella alpina]|nr:hypothetical protein BGZ72_002377 [Mortierella alpina]
MVNTQETTSTVDAANQGRRSSPATESDNRGPAQEQPSSEFSASTPQRRVVFSLPEDPHSFADAQLRCRLRPRRLAPPSIEVETAATALANANGMLQEFRRARALYAAQKLTTLAAQWNMHRADHDSPYPTTVMPQGDLELEQEFARYENASNACSSAIRRVKRCMSPLNDLLDHHIRHEHSNRTTQDEVVERVANAKRQRLLNQEEHCSTFPETAAETVPVEAFHTVSNPTPVPSRWYHISKDKRGPLEEVTVVLDSDDDRDSYVMSPFEPTFSKTPELGPSSPPESVRAPIEDIPEDERCRPCRVHKRPVSPHREVKCEYSFLD